MKKVAIVTDTTACIPPVKVEEYGIEIVPVPLIIDGKMYRDGIDITPAQFYEMIRKEKKTRNTSASAPEPYLEAFEKPPDGRRVSSALRNRRGSAPCMFPPPSP